MTRYQIVQEHALYFVTFSVVEWLPVFVAEEPCRIVTDSLNFCHKHKHLRVNAYVIMPTHLHAILFDEDFDANRLQQTLTDLRKYTGRQLTDHCVSLSRHVLPRRCGMRRGRTANIGSGRPAHILRRSTHRLSGNRSWTILTTTRVERAW